MHIPSKFFSGTLVAVLSAMVSPSAFAADSCVVKIGAIVPQTGALQVSGLVRPWIDNLKLDQVNKDGGIKIGDKMCKVEVKLYDSKSTPAGSGEAAEAAIVKDSVNVVMAAFTPDTTGQPSDACEKYEVPCITTSTPIEPWLMGSDGKPRDVAYGFNFFFQVSDLVKNHVATIKALPDGFNGKIGYLYPNDPDGLVFASLFAPAFAEEKWVGVDPGRVEEGLADFTPVAQKFKDEGVEVITGVLPPPDLANFLAAAKKVGLTPKLYLIDKATGFAEAMSSIGPAADGIVGVDFWSGAYVGNSKFGKYTGKELVEKYEAANPGKYASPLLGLIDSSYDVLFDALSRASDTTPAAITAALTSTDVNTVAGKLKFNDKHYAVTPIAAAQWQFDPQSSKWSKDAVVTLFPAGVKTNGTLRVYKAK